VWLEGVSPGVSDDVWRLYQPQLKPTPTRLTLTHTNTLTQKSTPTPSKIL
jgi:hypothetical protein